MKRREIWQCLGPLGLLLMLIAGPAGAAQYADTVFRNAQIYTVDPAQPWAQALAVAGSRIVAVGSDAAVEPWIGPETLVEDLQGAFLTPGFNDGHVHVDSTGALLVGVNLLREGLDLPEVSLVAILDADKEGFLRAERSLIQTIGRAARHANGHVIMYADRMTDSMKRAIDETNRRRTIQAEHNKQHGIEPQSIQKEVHDITEGIKAIAESRNRYNVVRKEMSRTDMFRVVKDLEVQMKESAKSLQFEKAAQFRDEIFELRRLLALEEKIIGPGDLMPEDIAAPEEEPA
mgnify:CR=1 FL=1